MRHADPNLLQAYCWYAVSLWPDWSAWAFAVSPKLLAAITSGHCNRMRNGDLTVTVYCACSATIDTPAATANRKSTASIFAEIRGRSVRPPRRRDVAFTGT